MLKGKVKTVGADATLEERTSQLYYETQIELDEKEIAQLEDVHLLSGMPAEVFIDLGERSLFQYFIQPMIDSFHRAFHEASSSRIGIGSPAILVGRGDLLSEQARKTAGRLSRGKRGGVWP